MRSWKDSPNASRSGPRCSSTSSPGKRSCPAGTGVWVVKTTSRATRGSACSNTRPSSCIRERIASRTAKTLWPSLRCRTPGVIPIARSARNPPTPSSSSWRMRTRPSPPYSRDVSSRSSGELPSTFESSRRRSHRPTRARHTLALMAEPRVSICTVMSSPLRPMAGSIGSWLVSVSRYSSCCHPLMSSRWRK